MMGWKVVEQDIITLISNSAFLHGIWFEREATPAAIQAIRQYCPRLRIFVTPQRVNPSLIELVINSALQFVISNNAPELKNNLPNSKNSTCKVKSSDFRYAKNAVFGEIAAHYSQYFKEPTCWDRRITRQFFL